MATYLGCIDASEPVTADRGSNVTLVRKRWQIVEDGRMVGFIVLSTSFPFKLL